MIGLHLSYEWTNFILELRLIYMKPNYNILLAFALLAFMVAFSSCEDKYIVIEDKALGYDYYPVEVGNFWIYKIDSTVVVRNGGQKELLETSSFVKEEIISSFLNEQGDTSYVIQRSASESLNESFRSTDIWKIEKTSSNVSRFEENLQFIKLVFPISVGDTWDGNLFDQRIEVVVAQQKMEPYLEWSYSVDSLNSIETINGEEYNDVLKVTQANYENDIEQRLSYEKYSPGIGMIYREMSILDHQCLDTMICNNLSFLEKADSGFQLRQTLVDYN